MHDSSKGHVIKVVQNATEITQVWCNEEFSWQRYQFNRP